MDTSQLSAAGAMVRAPKCLPASATVADARAAFANDHVHAVLIVVGGRLETILLRADLTSLPASSSARRAGRLTGRTVRPDAPVEQIRLRMIKARQRRLAVVDERGRLLGLLCLKRDGSGFCSDAGIRARAEERAAIAMRR